MSSSATDVKPMKDIEIITDPSSIKTLFEKTRSTIIFRYLVNGAMTVKQLSDAMGKNPGTILHHIDKLKEVGLVVQERTETTITGIVQRYYRATAREYRLGFGQMTGSDNGVSKFAQSRLTSMVKGLTVYGIEIKDTNRDEAINLLKHLLERENTIISNLPVIDEKGWAQLPGPVRRDTARLMRRFAIDEDPQYTDLKQKWNTFMKKNQTQKRSRK
ncbi:MAG: winged helix-turn-helix domain-containing protein [Candidatus Ranarchaeia archaeon]|jgi:DNA-binding transcriptional ArsR family regulator